VRRVHNRTRRTSSCMVISSIERGFEVWTFARGADTMQEHVAGVRPNGRALPFFCPWMFSDD